MRNGGEDGASVLSLVSPPPPPLRPADPPLPRPPQSRAQRLYEGLTAASKCYGYVYGAFTMYNNPWLVRAVVMALWSALRMLTGCC